MDIKAILNNHNPPGPPREIRIGAYALNKSENFKYPTRQNNLTKPAIDVLLRKLSWLPSLNHMHMTHLNSISKNHEQK